ncbi:translation initiation factor IF-3 [Apiospora kogelbergensis]|uniref:Translation initiation factor IF-3 n=1 Tax=Apiospora kogelbergensis TaxID=1337665 RepID=A0AAW0QLX0_9PEZI
MQHTRCLFSPARALQNVFLSSPDLSARRSMAAASSSIISRPATYLYPRLFSTNGGVRMKQYWVKVADETGALSEPQRTSDILAGLDRKKWSLVMVAPPPELKEEEEEEGVEDSNLSFQDMPLAEPKAAICRLIDKYAYAKVAEEKEKEARRKKLNTKEIELNWAIAAHDLGHRLTQLEGFLSKGKTVEVMLAKKRGGRLASKAEGEAIIEKIEETAASAGAVIAKREGAFPGIVKLRVDGPQKAQK